MERTSGATRPHPRVRPLRGATAESIIQICAFPRTRGAISASTATPFPRACQPGPFDSRRRRPRRSGFLSRPRGSPINSRRAEKEDRPTRQKCSSMHRRRQSRAADGAFSRDKGKECACLQKETRRREAKWKSRD
jgi:hypothetical protein